MDKTAHLDGFAVTWRCRRNIRPGGSGFSSLAHVLRAGPRPYKQGFGIRSTVCTLPNRKELLT